ncbi:MAG: hypothetical protein N2999_06640 [Proteobacteria bacterium]|nr:hypothetical protein [Pseudomonadota bacterium]
MKKSFLIPFFLFFLILTTDLYSFKIVDPKDEFNFIETENFRFYYPLRLKEKAFYIANFAEPLSKEINKRLKLKTYEKTHIVLLDYSDNMDGLSTNLPYNRVYLNIVPPDLLSTVGEFDNYLINLFIHEYLHILVMDSQKGYSEVTRKIFGKPVIPFENPSAFPFFLITAPPNVFLPKWFQEGFSTFGEGYFTGKGRGNFTLLESYFRDSIEKNDILRIDEINGDIGRYPYGHAPYWWGQKIFDYLESRYGIEKIGELIEDHSARFPYFINDLATRKFNQDYENIYLNALRFEIARQKKNIDTLKRSDLTPFEKINYPYESINSFAFSSDGLFIALDVYDPHSGNRLVIYNTDNNEKIFDIRKLPSCGSLAFSKDNKKLYFTQLLFKDISKSEQDIFELNLENKKTKKLTNNLRVKDLSYDDADDSLIGIKRDGIIENIVIIDKNLNVKKLTDFKESYHLSAPKISKDGESIVFTRKDLSGTYHLSVLNKKSNEIKDIISSPDLIYYPFFSRDNKKIYFITDKTGVFNLAEVEIDTKSVRILTNHFNGILRPAQKDSYLYFIYPTSNGFSLGSISNTNLSPQTPPAITKLAYQGKLELEKTENNFTEQKYSPIESMIPKFFLPNLFVDQEGSVLGAFTANQDVLGKHTYYLELDYGLQSNELYYKISYVNEDFAPSFKILSYSQPVLYYKFYRIADFWERETVLDLSASFKLPLPRTPKLKAGLRFEDKNSLSLLHNNTFYGIPVFEGEKNYFYLSLIYGRFRESPLSLGLESGYEIELTYNKYLPSFASDIKGYEILLSLAKYFQIGEISKHRTLFVNYKLGISEETKTAQNAFSLGGIPSLTNPFYLRGYPQNFQTGQYISTISLEYKYPLSYIFKGPGTKPIFLEKLYNVIFIDAGSIWDDKNSFRLNDVRNAIGTELRADITLGYWAKITPILGIAKGLNKDGATQIYFNITSNF